VTRAVLLLRLAGPMQSWGTRSRFTERDTEREPTKSGVVGLLCAALGRPRTEPLDDLVVLRMGVRVDREGIHSRDFHTTQGVLKADQRPLQLAGADLERVRARQRKSTNVSNRYFLADAAFLVGLEGERAFLEGVRRALRSPRWPLFLGRKSFVPSLPVLLPDGLRDSPLDEALASFPWLGQRVWKRYPKPPMRLRTVLEVKFAEDGMPRKDQPLDFLERRFVERRIRHGWVDTPAKVYSEEPTCT